jgi:D-arabinose 1-dehydrogenase-like Zn-dependent alcohol dehydrogenase
VLDYTKTRLEDLNKRFDIVLDTVGNISPKLAKKLLNNDGRAGLMVAGLGEMLRAHGQIKTGTATQKREDIEFLLNLIEEGKLKVVISKTYSIDNIVEAHRHVDSGHKVGNVIVKLQ